MRTALANAVSIRCSNDISLANDMSLGESTDSWRYLHNGTSLNFVVMTLGQRIEDRRRALGVSQSELARRVGMPQSSYNSLVNSDVRSTKYLHRLARELQTTPDYLMADTDDPGEGAPDGTILSADQRELLDLYNAMDDASRRSLMHVARSMGSPLPAKPTVHSPKLAYAGPQPRTK